jgi:UDP-GlcNAc3NAcA epimerase
MKIVSIVGARPEFVQAQAVSRALKGRHREILVHTGQHYDYLMSQTFFDELDIPTPDYNLEVKSGSHARQTGQMLAALETVLQDERPELVIVRGDTNSTVAGSLAAAKMHIPTAHIEAGERSYDRRMPEEINRLVADCVADLHLCASRSAVDNLAAEGITMSVHWVGDVMLDAMLTNRPVARRKSTIFQRVGVERGRYGLVTVHRAGNTDDPVRLRNIVGALNRAKEAIVFPVHPRTREALARLGASFGEHVRLIDPVGALDMIALEEGARLIATDSGGVQREAYFLGIPCLTLRDETEWVETVRVGWNRLVGADSEQIGNAWFSFAPPSAQPPIFGDGSAGEKIAALLDRGAPIFGSAGRTAKSDDLVRVEGSR